MIEAARLDGANRWQILTRIELLPIWIYNTAFSDFNLSEASAMSVILLLLIVLIALPYLVRSRHE